MVTSTSLLVALWVAQAGALEPPPHPEAAVSRPAADPEEAGAPQPATHQEPAFHGWYGYQLLMSDLASFYAISASRNTPVAAYVGAGGLLLGAPAIHFAHGNRVTGLVSLGSRFSLALIAGALFASEGNDPNCHDDVCKKTLDDAMPALVVLGADLAFMLIDDLVLARVSASGVPADLPPTARAISRPRFAPALAPRTGGATLALVGTF